LPRKGVIVYAGASDWFCGKIDSLYKDRKTFFIRTERPYIEQNFGFYRWKYILLAWKTWRQGKDDARIDWRRNYETLWHVLNNLGACDINMHSL